MAMPLNTVEKITETLSKGLLCFLSPLLQKQLQTEPFYIWCHMTVDKTVIAQLLAHDDPNNTSYITSQ